ncbi:hypothetical protein GTQ99_01430 [Kineococcus sp. T13]|uniref:hypothetical protein n=1 Tax=Kineococcus vitellinus TaxID=2696565 RepID=UPI001412DAF9|nr:hypothetical protein [Kineococcus vitellinus]NAZ74093.1 hypothetical protein [Kineococcus vitellinus]
MTQRDPHQRQLTWPVLLFGQALVGVVVGFVWWALTRRPGDWLVGEPVVTSTSMYPIARDGVFAVLTGLLGLAAGLLVAVRPGPRPLVTFVAALVGALAGALLAAGLGSSLPPTPTDDPAHVTLLAWAVLLVQAFAVAAVVASISLVRAVLDLSR